MVNVNARVRDVMNRSGLAALVGDEHFFATDADAIAYVEALAGEWTFWATQSRSMAIAGGTTEVNKNIVAERVLGLPREPSR